MRQRDCTGQRHLNGGRQQVAVAELVKETAFEFTVVIEKYALQEARSVCVFVFVRTACAVQIGQYQGGRRSGNAMPVVRVAMV